MANLFFQGRGNVYLQPILVANDGTETLGAGITLCTDQFAFSQATESATHINKCGRGDVEDDRYTKSQTATLTMELADAQDKIFALGVLGTVNAAGSPGTVVAEELPTSLPDGSVWFLGGKTRHRAITGLTITGMTLTTDYTFDAASGKVTFVGDQSASPAPTASYGYTDPQYVSLFTAGSDKYMLSYEFMNKRNANDEGSMEFYKVVFDPAQNIDLQSDELQIMNFSGSALADLTRPDDKLLGQFGRRVL